MLPDKDELNNEIIEQISGGGGYTRLRDPIQAANPTQEADPMQEVAVHAIALPSAGTMKDFYISQNSGKQYPVIEQRTDSYGSNCDSQITPKIAPVGGDLKATVPNISDKDRLIKIH